MPAGFGFWVGAVLEPPEGDSHVLVQTVDGPPAIHLALYAEKVDGEVDRSAFHTLGRQRVR